MKAEVVRLRVAGVRITQAELAEAPKLRGELSLDYWAQNNAFRRPLQVAKLGPENPLQFHPDLLPPLFDAQVLRIRSDQLLIAGIEIYGY